MANFDICTPEGFEQLCGRNDGLHSLLSKQLDSLQNPGQPNNTSSTAWFSAQGTSSTDPSTNFGFH